MCARVGMGVCLLGTECGVEMMGLPGKASPRDCNHEPTTEHAGSETKVRNALSVHQPTHGADLLTATIQQLVFHIHNTSVKSLSLLEYSLPVVGIRIARD